ncbi:hypothetical protein CLV62_10256 [Dysgonomonas alginatilytica]|uniref:Uncharacterized protein n=1 Tax=Dysgonomonas alginatilytica TaxID=1605892 RepID=A0A2V3PUG0_9BACT|nr:hypothetical protein [Dysgonomonas alginatilytica]PXV68026.1 hypothetical protein CLV62_10256 [Dysgonomonas alginatilytica]
MTTLKESPYTYFSGLLKYGKSVLNCSLESIEESFSTYEHCISRYFNKSEWHTRIEIQLKNATLTCSMDSENKCQIAYLLLDNLSDIGHYIRYCDQTHPYNHEIDRWITDYGYLRISFEAEQLFFVLMPVSAT